MAAEEEEVWWVNPVNVCIFLTGVIASKPIDKSMATYGSVPLVPLPGTPIIPSEETPKVNGWVCCRSL